MGSSGLIVTPLTWVLALAPIAVLVGLVLWGRGGTTRSALAAVALALAIGFFVFGGHARVLAVATGKGLWLGLWILYVIWPALLLYLLARRVGLTEMGETLESLLPRPIENVLLIAWVLPSFVQGVAGFGTPIAVAAPLLMSMGLPAALAVALPLVGYHWSVTFGSMGSSFYMGGFTANLTGDALASYAGSAALMLSVNAMIAGALVAFMYDGWRGLRQGSRLIIPVGLAMGLVLNLAVRVEPAVGSLAAGAAGLAAVFGLRLARRGRSNRVRTPAVGDPTTTDLRRLGVIVLPYLYLLVAVMVVFVPRASRTWVKEHLLIAPSFPATVTREGFQNASVETFTPIATLGHPGSYIFMAALLGYVTYRAVGIWERGRHPLGREWVRLASKSSSAVLLLGALAMIMVDTGMIRTLAIGAADVAGRAFPGISPVIGSIGAFMTGSTTNSNALFSAFQRDVALLIEVAPSSLVAAQTVGGNIGNSIAPVVILVGASALAAQEQTDQIFRRVIGPAGVLMGTAMVMAVLFAYLL